MRFQTSFLSPEVGALFWVSLGDPEPLLPFGYVAWLAREFGGSPTVLDKGDWRGEMGLRVTLSFDEIEEGDDAIFQIAEDFEHGDDFTESVKARILSDEPALAAGREILEEAMSRGERPVSVSITERPMPPPPDPTGLPYKIYRARIFRGQSQGPGRVVELRARTSSEAALRFKRRFPEFAVYNIYNEEDSFRPRGS